MPYLAFAGTLLNGARGVWINKIVNRAALSINLNYGALKQVRIQE